MPQDALDVFQFSLPELEGAVDELGLWKPVPPPRAAGDSYGSVSLSGGTPTAEVPSDLNYFRAGLPIDASQSERILTGLQDRLSASNWRMNQAQLRLEAFMALGGLPEVAYALPGQAVPAAEIRLQGWMEAFAPGESFGSLPKLPPDWTKTVHDASNFFTKIQLLLTLGDLIESRRDDQRLGLTVVSLSGDFTTIWSTRSTRADLAVHQQVLGQAIAIRAAWFRLASLILGGAVKLAGLFSTSFILAIPAAYQFFRQVLEQVRDWPQTSPQLIKGNSP
jgi:hypothetical protein